MTDHSSIRGFRIVGDAPKQRELSMGYLQQSSEASRLLQELWHRAPIEGAPCVGNSEAFTGDTLMTDREAQLACSPCALKDLCLKYADTAHVAYGTWGGTVRGRALAEAMKDDEEIE